ncbi:MULTISPECIES: N-acetylglucosamine kinase [Microbacterium]|uniref:N-acetylglucosamine kinase n=1 Tax=Microbacterium TaxID=33882 RepID=UPI00217D1FFF|nr:MULTISPECIES: BadF/BadG/BcrA/BcrD ATPase family protein [Microbacterium]
MTAIEGALAGTGLALADVAVITAAMAGQRTSGDDDWLRRRLAQHGFAGRLTFESDLLATYFSGTAAPFGYALVSGTGACVIRVSAGVIEATGDGLGWLLGDRGSGFWIGHRVAKAVVGDLDGTGPATGMTPRVIAHLGVHTGGPGAEGRSQALIGVVGALYARPPIELAGLAPIAFADAGDPVAAGILRRAGEELADTLSAVLSGPGPLVLGGSVLSRSGPVRDAFLHRLGTVADRLEPRPVADGAVGAGQLALRAAGVVPTEETLLALTASLARFR